MHQILFLVAVLPNVLLIFAGVILFETFKEMRVDKLCKEYNINFCIYEFSFHDLDCA